MTLGSIIVRLSMATADFETDAGRAAKVAQKRAQEIDAAFKKAGAAIAVALGAAVVVATASIRDAVNRMDDLSKAAQRVGMPTEDFSRLAYAGDLADVSMEALVGSLGKLTKAQAAALKDTSEQARVFEALGISVTDAEGKMRSSSDVLLDFADRFKALNGSPEAMAAGFSLFGRSFQEMIPLLKDGSAGLREAAAESDALGKTVFPEAGHAAEEFNDNITRLQSAIGGAWMEIARGMLPNLNRMTGEMVAAAKESDNLRQFGDVLGNSFAFVAGMARQFSIDLDAATQAASGWAEITKNIASLGLADGTFTGGLGKIKSAEKNRDKLTADAQHERALAVAAANIDRLIVNGTGTYNGPLLAPSKFEQDAANAAKAQTEALRKALGDTSKGAGKSAAAKLSEEDQAYRRLNEAMAERIALFGKDTEEAKLNYEITSGSLQKLSQGKKDELLLQARQLDALDVEMEARKAAAEATKAQTEAALDHKAAIEGVLSDYEQEYRLLGMSRQEQEKFLALKHAGVNAWDEEGQAITDWIEKVQGARDARQLLDGVQDSMTDMLASVLDGSASVGDAFEDMFDSIKKKAAAFLAEKAIQKLFDWLFGSVGGSSSGGGGFLAGLFGGGRASGGPVSGSRLYEVGEGGKPEMFQQGGRTYLIPGNDGRVIPATAGLTAPVIGDGGGSTYVNVVNNSGQPAQTTERMDGLNKIIDVVIGEVDKRIASNGSTGKVIGSRFGLQPVGVARG